MKFDVSVAIPVYNQEQYIRQAIESCFKNQCNVEVVVLNDGSTDGTLDVINKIITPDHVELVVIDEKKNSANIGLNMHKLYSQCRGDYISELGADDFYLPNALDKMKEALDNLPSDIGFLYSSYLAMPVENQTDQETKIKQIPHPANKYYLWENNPKERLMINNFVTPPCLLRKELYNQVCYDSTQEVCPDYLFKLELSRVTNFFKLSTPLSVVRVRSNSISNDKTKIERNQYWESQARQKVRKRYGDL